VQPGTARDGDAVRDLGEDRFVAGVLARYPASPGFVLVGPGDDAAVLDLPGRVVASTDTLVEGHDFLLTWSTGHDLGVKVAAQNLADVAAMGAVPRALLVSLCVPPDQPAAWAQGLADGLADECARAGAAVVGGDVSAAGLVVVTGTALGVLDGDLPPVRRSGAVAGQVIALGGPTGRSAAGLALLRAGVPREELEPWAADLVTAHLAPRPPHGLGVVAARAGAGSMIDTSDGLLRDAGRLAVASAVALDLEPDALRPGPALVRAAEMLGDPALAPAWVLTGGEDHALLATFPPDGVPAGFVPVGRVLAAGSLREAVAGEVLVGGRRRAGPTGWVHFG